MADDGIRDFGVHDLGGGQEAGGGVDGRLGVIEFELGRLQGVSIAPSADLGAKQTFRLHFGAGFQEKVQHVWQVNSHSGGAGHTNAAAGSYNGAEEHWRALRGKHTIGTSSPSLSQPLITASS